MRLEPLRARGAWSGRALFAGATRGSGRRRPAGDPHPRDDPPPPPARVLLLDPPAGASELAGSAGPARVGRDRRVAGRAAGDVHASGARSPTCRPTPTAATAHRDVDAPHARGATGTPRSCSRASGPTGRRGRGTGRIPSRDHHPGRRHHEGRGRRDRQRGEQLAARGRRRRRRDPPRGRPGDPRGVPPARRLQAGRGEGDDGGPAAGEVRHPHRRPGLARAGRARAGRPRTRATATRSQLANELGCRSIAFPAISTGVYGYPVHLAAEVAAAATGTLEHLVEEIVFVLFSDAAHEEYAGALERRKSS